jgi:hypothetical protein
MREAVEQAIIDYQIKNPVTAAWLEEQILTSTDPKLLWFLAERLKGLPVSAEFPQKLFRRIDPAGPAETNLLFIRCLLDHTDPQSESAAKLKDLEAAMECLYVLQLGQQLKEDLRWMIEQTEISQRQVYQIQIEQLESLKVPD